MAKKKIKDPIIEKVVKSYLKSLRFNGIRLSDLANEIEMSPQDTKLLIEAYVSEGTVSLTFSGHNTNPYILMFKPAATDIQIERLHKCKPEDTLIYPTENSVKSIISLSKYNKTPFTKMMAQTMPQLDYVYFDLDVLSRYFEDPRYRFSLDDFGGSIHMSDSFGEADDTNERDKVFLQTFGIGYNSKKERIVAVHVYYLTNLSPEHQRVWETYLIPKQEGCRPSYIYHQTSMGEWPEYVSMFQAFLEELKVINKYLDTMGWKPLFKKTFENDRPKDFAIVLRPTLSNLDRFVHVMDKMLSENLNKDFFKQFTKLSMTETVKKADGAEEIRERGTLALLEEWINTSFNIAAGDNELSEKVFLPLRDIRKRRQKPAHAINKDVYDKKFIKEQEDLLNSAYRALRILRQLLANLPNAKSVEVPDWLFKGKITLI